LLLNNRNRKRKETLFFDAAQAVSLQSSFGWQDVETFVALTQHDFVGIPISPPNNLLVHPISVKRLFTSMDDR